jgi:predicted dehydrogenase
MITKVLIIGAGAIAHLHAKAALKLNPVPKIAAADPNAASRESFFTAFPGSLMFESAEAEALASEARALGLELACCSSRFSARPITAEIRRLLGTGELGKGLRVLWQVRVNGDINGLSYQPQSRWFLDRSKAGGGTLFDWGCYDLAVWSEIFHPVGITVDAAWTGHPRRGEDVPEGVVFDVEHQVAAQLRLHLGDGTEVPVSYERASVCHGIGSTLTQIEGDRGALN